MPEDNAEPEAPSLLSPALVETLDNLDEAELRAVIDYATERQDFLHTAVADNIEPGTGEEIVSIEEQVGYTEVIKREPCDDGCDECPHGPFLYHVREETRPDGDTKLHWHYLGPVQE
ncbi:hypothetical protein [Halovenus salina]|uniref:Uncharacterized protein n=1 Tax=Halovenus salina TaxID=1510225 RepID=A0ABD5W457_9EURY|nr:hypothetical protein [Halovenus salina]